MAPHPRGRREPGPLSAPPEKGVLGAYDDEVKYYAQKKP